MILPGHPFFHSGQKKTTTDSEILPKQLPAIMETHTDTIFNGYCGLFPVAAAIGLLVATPVFRGFAGWTILAAAILSLALVLPLIIRRLLPIALFPAERTG